MNRNITIKISNEKEFNYVQNYCQQKYKNNKFDIDYDDYDNTKWIYINQNQKNYFSFIGFFAKDRELPMCPSKYYPKLNYFVINNFINFIREDKLKQILNI